MTRIMEVASEITTRQVTFLVETRQEYLDAFAEMTGKGYDCTGAYEVRAGRTWRVHFQKRLDFLSTSKGDEIEV